MSKRKSKYTGKSNRTLDILWAKKVKKEAGNECEMCRSVTNLQAHHIIPRKIYVTRWDIRNGICLCQICHYKGNYSAHKNPISFFLWIIKNRGNDWAENLADRAKNKYNKNDKPKIKDELLP